MIRSVRDLDHNTVELSGRHWPAGVPSESRQLKTICGWGRGLHRGAEHAASGGVCASSVVDRSSSICDRRTTLTDKRTAAVAAGLALGGPGRRAVAGARARVYRRRHARRMNA